MSYSLVLFCKLAGLQSKPYLHFTHRSSVCLSFTTASTVLENTLRLKLVHGNEVKSFGKRFGTKCSCLSPEAEYLSQVPGVGDGDDGNLFCE